MLNLSRNNLTSIDLEPLRNCTQLEKLFLYYNRVGSIDLEPLRNCTQLQFLMLYGMALETINLEPLSACTQLRKLELNLNQFKSIDLEPLRNCSNLKELDLTSNDLESIDLSSLSSCTKLLDLKLSYNELTSIDLTPLYTFPHLRYITLSGNKLESIDVTPVKTRLKIWSDTVPLSWLKTEWGLYKRPKGPYPWSFLYKVADHEGSDIRVQQDILSALGLGDYGFIDCDLRDMFLSIHPDTSLKTAIDHVRSRIVEEILNAIECGKTTTGMEIDRVTKLHGEIALRTQHIIDLRNDEMEKVQITKVMAKIHLRELWLTSYGYEVLSALGMRLTILEEELPKLEAAMNRLGWKLRVGKEAVPGVEMSDELREAIWWIADNEGEEWWWGM
jgi:hypothetical protein